MAIEFGLTGKRSIEQCLRVLILTPKGSVPFRPEFGIDAESLMAQPYNPTLLKKKIIEQINRYEPRIEVKRIIIQQGDNVGAVRVVILYKIKDTGEECLTIAM